MKKSIIRIFIPICLIILGALMVWWATADPSALDTAHLGYLNTTYEIEGQMVSLVDGESVLPIVPGSVSMMTTNYFGNLAVGDLNGDTTDDVAFILTNESGGSGTFYYVVSALRGPRGYHGTNAIFLGDRILPVSTEIVSGKIIVTYTDRLPEEPLSIAPHVTVTKHLTIEGGRLIEILERSEILPVPVVSKCYVGGCSGQICSDQEDVASTCEYHESYACYQSATCERQLSGECGWTPTPELSACLGE